MARWGSSIFTEHSTVLIVLWKLVSSSTVVGLSHDVPLAADGSDAWASLNERQPFSPHLEHEHLPPDIPDEEHLPEEELPSNDEHSPVSEDEVSSETPCPEHDASESYVSPEEVPSWSPPPHAKRDSFRALDANADGYVTRHEFESGFPRHPEQPCNTESTMFPCTPAPVQLTPDEELAVLCKECEAKAGLGSPEFHQRCVANEPRCHVWLAPLKPAPYHGVHSLSDAKQEVNKFAHLESEVLEKSGQSEAAAEIVRRDEKENEASDSEAMGINIIVAILGTGLSACTGLILGYEIEEVLRKKKAGKEDAQVAGAEYEQGEGNEQTW
eukprot:6143114-Amphidinium_carterae.1